MSSDSPTSDAQQYTGPRGGALRYYLAFLILPNLVFAVLGQFGYVHRALINVDYPLLGIVAPFLGVGLTTAALMALLLLDGLITLSSVFHFTLGAALSSLSEPLKLNLRIVLPLAGLIIACLGFTSFAIVRLGGTDSPSRTQSRVILAVVVIISSAIDLLGGASQFSPFLTTYIPINVAQSGVFAVSQSLGRALVNPPSTTPPVLRSDSHATDAIFDKLRRGSVRDSLNSANVALVIVESLGLFSKDRSNQVVLGPLLTETISKRYEVRSGKVRTDGATTQGELRELCDVDADHRSVSAIDPRICLPSMFRLAGYDAIAIHGFTGHLFERSNWYARLGFARTWFSEDILRRPGVRQCGRLLRGVCDTDAAQIVSDELRAAPRGEPRFVYWMTLNSHLPVDPESAAASPLACARLAEGHNPDICRLTRILQKVISAVAAIAMDSTIPPTRFILVGDHPPPFFWQAERSLFVDHRVPFVELIPR